MRTKFANLSYLLAFLAAALALAPVARADTPLDTLVFGNAASEEAHGLRAERSDTIKGGLDVPARRLLPLDGAPAADLSKNWEGGRVLFTLKVDPAKINYVTIRLWGSDITPDRLVLFAEGKQIGYHLIGDVDILDFGSDIGEPGFNGRFFYNTEPLPLALTKGRATLHCEIRATGRIWSYGNTFARYQNPMTEPSRGLYSLYTHTGNGCFIPPADEKQGEAPQDPPVRKTPGPEVLDALKARLTREVNGFLTSAKPLNQMQMELLARAYAVAWTPAYKNPKAIDQIVSGLDNTYRAYKANPRLAVEDPVTPNPDWFGLGPSGDVIRLLAEPLRPLLDATIDDGAGGKTTRRAGYAAMLVACRDWHRRHRRLYTNQTMINDTYGVYLANRGVEVTDPAQAMPETQVMRYLYESVGLQPWRDSDPADPTDTNPERRQNWGIGNNYFEITAKGLTKELGYVGSYGEVIDWATTLYDATRPAPNQPGDSLIEAQIEKIANARAIFRYPALDADGKRAMRLEPIIGWRDSHYPGDVTYGERTTWDASALYNAAETLDPQEIGYAKQMMADNQFFASIEDRVKDKGLRVTAGLLDTPDEFARIEDHTVASKPLPMSIGQPDFVWTDEEDGVIAIKHGADILYASLYWRARNAINSRARVHYITPRVDRIAVVAEETQFTPSGMTFTQPDYPDTEMPGGGKRYPESVYGGMLHQGFAGEVLPIAKIPAEIKFKPGDENVYAGRGDFYTLRYGPYLIAMNSTSDRSIDYKIPADIGSLTELTTGHGDARAGSTIVVKPRTTAVFYAGESKKEVAR